MKFTRTDNQITGDTTITLIITDKDITKAMPTRFEKEALRVAEATDKISDKLFYLSELAKNIEDNLVKESR